MNIVLRVLPGLVVAAMAVTPTPARAELTWLPKDYAHEPCRIFSSFQWKPVKAGDQVPVPRKGDPNDFWDGGISTTAGAPNGIDVSADIVHIKGCQPGGDADSKVIPLALKDVDPGGNLYRAKVTAAQVSHGKDIDIGYLKATVDRTKVGGSTVAVSALHVGAKDQKATTASFTNDTDLRTFKTVKITPDYTDPKDPKTIKYGKEIERGSLGPHESLTQSLPPELEGNPSFRLSSYRIEAAASPPTITDLAFLGDVDGTFGELDLAAMLDLMLGTNDMLAPYLRPLIGDDTDPLYVAIDLTQWVGLTGSFHIGDVFNLVDGMSDLLPGLLVGRSPITLGVDGYHTDNAYNGDVVAVATIDGKVPEPRGLALVVLALALLAAVRRARRPVAPH